MGAKPTNKIIKFIDKYIERYLMVAGIFTMSTGVISGISNYNEFGDYKISDAVSIILGGIVIFKN